MTPDDTTDITDTWVTIELNSCQWSALRDHLAGLPDSYTPLGLARFQVQQQIAAGTPAGQFTRREVGALLGYPPNMIAESADLAYAYAVLANAVA